MNRKFLTIIMAAVICVTMITGCGNTFKKRTTITVFAAKSLNNVMEELITRYNETNPNVIILGNYDSSGTLMAQIKEGATCDIFFSAAQKQMDLLEEDGFIVEGTRHEVLNNQVCVVTYEGSLTKVEGLDNLKCAKNFALAAGSVPVGKYTRQALINKGVLSATDDVSKIDTQTISEALGGIEINECANAGAVVAAVCEGANEIGTVYYSDIYGRDDKLEIIEIIPYDLTGDVIYPVAQIINTKADGEQINETKLFMDFLLSESAKEIYRKYNFDVP